MRRTVLFHPPNHIRPLWNPQDLISNLLFIGPCIIITFTKYNQKDANFLNLFSSQDALHVSGGSSAHHQEHKTVHTASGICQTNAATCCYRGRGGLSSLPRE